MNKFEQLVAAMETELAEVKAERDTYKAEWYKLHRFLIYKRAMASLSTGDAGITLKEINEFLA